MTLDPDTDITLCCPRCSTPMRSAERHGVEVDICPDCWGVWLDRGEVDKIINRLAVGDPGGFPYLFERDVLDETDHEIPGGQR